MAVLDLLRMLFNQGTVTARPREALAAGEMQASTGGYYKPGDTERIWKQGGRAVFGLVGAGGSELLIHDPDLETWVLNVLTWHYDSGNTFTKSTVAQAGSFAAAMTPLNAGEIVELQIGRQTGGGAPVWLSLTVGNVYIFRCWLRSDVARRAYYTVLDTTNLYTYAASGWIAGQNTDESLYWDLPGDGMYHSYNFRFTLSPGVGSGAALCKIPIRVKGSQSLVTTYLDSVSLVLVASRINGLALTLFDAGTDLLLALSGTAIYKATPGVTGAFTSLITGLSSLTSRLSAVHFNDRWFLGTGYDRNKVVESDSTTRNMGMEAPASALTASASLVTAVGQRATAETQGANPWTNPANARDADTATFAHTTLSNSSAAASQCTWTGFAAATDTGRQLVVLWHIGSGGPFGGGNPTQVGNEGGTVNAGYDVNILIEYSIDNGANFVTLVAANGFKYSQLTIHQASVPVSANTNLVRFRAKLTYNSGQVPATLRIYDGRVENASVAAFSTTSGLTYGYTEYDELRGLESPISPLTAVSLTNQNVVDLGNFPTARNSNATKWRIYRNFDGGPVPATLGLLDAIPIAQTTYRDTFARFAYNVPPIPLYRLLTVTVDQATLRFALDAPPPALAHMNVFRASIVGVRKDKPRSLPYSAAGYPESWPEVNVIENFPMPEHDQLVATATIGETLLIGAQDLMLTLRGLPRVLLGTFDASKAEPLRGQPGLVNQDALVTFSVEGEARAAWGSRFGIHETNGLEARRISDDQLWASIVATASLSTLVLRWDPERVFLIVCGPSSTADNDRYWFIHMAPAHQKANGFPKWTGPHYGAIASMAMGVVAGVHRVYSGHTADGTVYLENTGGTDASMAYSGTLSPLILQLGRLYSDWRQFAIVRANLRHTDFGAGQTGTLDVTAGRDPSGTTQAVQKTVALDGQQGEDLLIARSGEWVDAVFTHTGSGTGAVLDLRCEAKAMGKAGPI